MYTATRGPNVKWGGGHDSPPHWRRSCLAMTGTMLRDRPGWTVVPEEQFYGLDIKWLPSLVARAMSGERNQEQVWNWMGTGSNKDFYLWEYSKDIVYVTNHKQSVNWRQQSQQNSENLRHGMHPSKWSICATYWSLPLMLQNPLGTYFGTKMTITEILENDCTLTDI